MIVLDQVTKTYVLDGLRKTVLDNVTAVFPTGASVGLLGRNGAGKTTLLRMIAGIVDVTAGRILSDGAISFPVGFAGSFHPEMTGAQNARFVARIYGADTDSLIDFVREFAELGPHFHLPLKTYSSGMRSRLAFGVSMGLKFDTYLIDEITAVGDAAFKKKSRAMFLDRLHGASAVFVSHSMRTMREMCTAGAVIEGGRLYYHDRIEDAIDHHARNMGV
ncbi:MAG: ABC transporter ATP-binding protein [Rubellimicrobium sp.]|nr:ABC transporter ATP-binding protein [Rubellimicrobium sp.]